MKKKIALTGGPNSGKTTALSVLKEWVDWENAGLVGGERCKTAS